MTQSINTRFSLNHKCVNTVIVFLVIVFISGLCKTCISNVTSIIREVPRKEIEAGIIHLTPNFQQKDMDLTMNKNF